MMEREGEKTSDINIGEKVVEEGGDTMWGIFGSDKLVWFISQLNHLNYVIKVKDKSILILLLYWSHNIWWYLPFFIIIIFETYQWKLFLSEQGKWYCDIEFWFCIVS